MLWSSRNNIEITPFSVPHLLNVVHGQQIITPGFLDKFLNLRFDPSIISII